MGNIGNSVQVKIDQHKINQRNAALDTTERHMNSLELMICKGFGVDFSFTEKLKGERAV